MRITILSVPLLRLYLAGVILSVGRPAPVVAAAGDVYAEASQLEPCGTWLILQQHAGPGARFEPAARPDNGLFQNGSVHFLVHYDDAGLDAYTDSILSAAEKAYAIIMNDLLFNAPPSDGTNGGDSRTDIYIRPSTSFPHLGETLPETWKGAPYPNSYTSYVELVDTLSLGLLLTTSAHEFFHVVQLGYDADENVSFLEMTAVWMEDIVYDDINAYRRYLPNFFSRPEKALFSFTYNNVIWAIYLSENFGNSIIREIFETAAATEGDDVQSSIESVLNGYGTTLAEQFVTFTRWNYYTGLRDDGFHYQEGAFFPQVKIEKTYDCLPELNYLLHGNAHTDTLRVDMLPAWYATSILNSIRFFPGETSTVQLTYQPYTAEPMPYDEPRWAEADSLLLIYNITTSAQSSNNYGFSIYSLPTVTPSPSYLLVLDRDGCRRPFDGNGDEFSTLAGEDYPFASELAGLNVRFILSDSLPADLNLCDAVFVIGGYDGVGVNMQAAELETLMTYMNHGGDVYLESNRLGSWLDPNQGSPTTTEEQFWSYFGCDFLPGQAMATGNVSAWRTPAGSALGAYSFDYDWGSPADDLVGELLPTTADTLAVDQSGRVRAVLQVGANESFRIHSTVLLGASTGAEPGSSRANYLYRILEVLHSTVSALAVSAVEATCAGGRVSLSGTVEGYAGQHIDLLRTDPRTAASEIRLPVNVQSAGRRGRFEVSDTPPAGYTYIYRLVAVIDGADRILWQGEVTVGTPPPALCSVYPNPSRGAFNLVLESAETARGWFRIFDAAGRQIHAELRVLPRGRSEIHFEGLDASGRRLSSGVYFLRLDTPAASFQRKVIVIR
jgi:hypothetical protein